MCLVCHAADFENASRNRSKNLPVDMLFKFHKRILQFCQAVKQEMFVEKAQWIDNVHPGKGQRNEFAVKYRFPEPLSTGNVLIFLMI